AQLEQREEEVGPTVVTAGERQGPSRRIRLGAKPTPENSANDFLGFSILVARAKTIVRRVGLQRERMGTRQCDSQSPESSRQAQQPKSPRPTQDSRPDASAETEAAKKGRLGLAGCHAENLPETYLGSR